jgi:hypothetical protein
MSIDSCEGCWLLSHGPGTTQGHEGQEAGGMWATAPGTAPVGRVISPSRAVNYRGRAISEDGRAQADYESKNALAVGHREVIDKSRDGTEADLGRYGNLI